MVDISQWLTESMTTWKLYKSTKNFVVLSNNSESQNGDNKISKQIIFLKNEHFYTPDTHMYVWLSGGGGG